MLKLLSIVLACFVLTSCLEKKLRDLESPCVANEYNASSDNEPCVRRPANAWISKV
ncbi:MAG: DUF2706 domain-containing protein [Alphaproteobacteria bacterium]|nr:DUF2706 domain-containing protein [Alphaproteobacteria bacterium]